MARTVHCVYLKRDAEGLDFAPYPGELGKRIYASVSKEGWAAWMKHQTMLVNENRLNLADQRARALGLESIFVLTTRTMHWFIKRGFVQVDADWLPEARKRKYNWDRRSQVFVKKLA